MAAASLLEGSGALGVAGSLSPAAAFSLVRPFSAGGAFPVVDGVSVGDDLVVVAGRGLVVVVPFAALVPFGALVPFVGVDAFVDGAAFDGIALAGALSARSFADDATVDAESTAAVGAVSGRTPGAHALAMTMAISGSRA